MDDAKLLREYVANHSEAAFQALVERHVSLVYFAALRRVGNASLAEDITQVVFVTLARKAGELSKNTVLSGWLYRTTWFVADKAVRAESRRRQREQEAMQVLTSANDPVWDRLSPVLEEAMARLGQMDRTVVLLRYFENRSLREVGYALGISEDTAQKRVSRAIVKLRGLFVKLGVPVSASDMTTMISTQAVSAAPIHLAALAAKVGVGGATGSATGAWLLQQTIRKPFWPKIVLVGGSALLLVTVATVVISHYRAQKVMPNQPVRGTPGQVSIRFRLPGPLPRAVPGLANIRFNLIGTPGLNYDAVYAHDTQTQQVTGVLPDQISFRADAFTAAVNVHGPGLFGFEIYRDDRRISWGAPATFTNTSHGFSIESRAGGQGIFLHQTGTAGHN